MKPCPICAMAKRLDKSAKWGKPVVLRSSDETWPFRAACSKCGLGDNMQFSHITLAEKAWNELASVVAEALRVAGTWCGPLTKAVRR